MNGTWATSKEHNDQKWNASNLQNLVYLTTGYDMVHLVFLFSGFIQSAAINAKSVCHMPVLKIILTECLFITNPFINIVFSKRVTYQFSKESYMARQRFEDSTILYT